MMDEGITLATTVSHAGWRSHPVELAPIPCQGGSPKWLAYQVGIPEGWTALLPVFCQVPCAPRAQTGQGILDAVNREFAQFEAAILLYRPGTDGREALREFGDAASLEAAFLGLDGQYLQSSQTRPAFALLRMEDPSSNPGGRSRSDECLVLLPLAETSSGAARDSIAPVMMFVDGRCVYRADGVSP